MLLIEKLKKKTCSSLSAPGNRKQKRKASSVEGASRQVVSPILAAVIDTPQAQVPLPSSTDAKR